MFKKYKIYTVYVDPNEVNPLESAILIPEQFNFFAAIFQGLWTLYQRLWFISAILVGLSIGLSILELKGFISVNISIIVNLGVFIFVGFQANDWIRGRLTRKGYILSSIVSGYTELDASRRYFDHMLGQGTAQNAYV